jgi:hypothetical protein
MSSRDITESSRAKVTTHPPFRFPPRFFAEASGKPPRQLTIRTTYRDEPDRIHPSI